MLNTWKEGQFMKKEDRKRFYGAAGLLAAFVLWTAALCLVDVRPIGPLQSRVGFAGLNQFFHKLIGVHETLYILTDWLGLVPLGFCFGFGLLGLLQWIRRKHLLKVERSILLLGGFYVGVLALYLLFEKMVINYRPVLIEGCLEASYPSSTTLLVLCVLPTAMMQLNKRIKKRSIRYPVLGAMAAFTFLMVVGRILSGVHWFSDIVGGILLSAGLVLLYCAVDGLERK